MPPLPLHSPPALPQDGLAFILKMAECVPIAIQLLGSKVVSDVLEALEFLSVCVEFAVRGSSAGLRRALVLVWSPEAAVREALLSAYLRLYMKPEVGAWHYGCDSGWSLLS